MVSVVVPAYNEAAVIGDCLDALVDQTYPDQRYEVIVVDDGSRDDTASVVRDYPVTLARTDRSESQFAARNTGLDRASGEVIAFTDADVTVASDWIDRGVDALAALQGPAVVYGRVEPALSPAPNRSETYDVLRTFDSDLQKTWNLFTTRAVFEEVGRFSPGLVSGGDVEWSERVRASEVPIRTDDRVRASHPPRRSLGALWGMSVRQGFGSGQRMRLSYDERTLALVAKEPLRLLDWYGRVLQDVAADSPWLETTWWDRVATALLAVPLGVAMAAGRLRGIVDGPGGDRTVGDYA
jgi:hypothetical protein